MSRLPPRETDGFFLSDREVFLRSWWFSSFLVLGTLRSQRAFEDVAGITALRASGMFHESKEGQKLFELIAYASACVLRRLRDDIEEMHGWTNESYELHIGYQVCFGAALDQTFGLSSQGQEFFPALVGAYYLPEYGHDYDDFWGIADEDAHKRVHDPIGELGQTASESRLCKPSDAEPYTIDRYYAFRIGRIYRVVDPMKVLENARPCRVLALSLYRPAFVEHPLWSSG